MGKPDALNLMMGHPYEIMAWVGRHKYSSTQTSVGATHKMQMIIPFGNYPGLIESIENHGGSPFLSPSPRGKNKIKNDTSVLKRLGPT
jgi:hypothetical protein